MPDLSLSRALEAVRTHPLLRRIGEIGRREGVASYVIGGYVRDLLMGRPTKDIDIMVIGSGVDFARKVRKALAPKAPLSVYRRFGTAQLTLPEGEVEFVGARKESYRRDSRKPMVEDGSLEDDLSRRDFTINAMAIGLSGPHEGRLIDRFGGLEDLQLGLIRTPKDPDKTFDDDPLRMLRAIRFATQLGFDIEHHTFEAIRKNKDRIRIVSPERIRDELNKIIMSERPSTGFKLLEEAGLLEYILPELTALKGVKEQDGQRHKDNFYHTLQVLDNIAPHTDNLWLRWAALLHDIGKPRTRRFVSGEGWTFHGHEVVGARMVPKIFRRLALPLGEPMRYVQQLVRLHQRPVQLVTEPITDSALRRLAVEAGEALDDLFTLCQADITTRDRQRKARYQKRLRTLREKVDEVIERDRLRNWQPPITGHIIMETFDIPPSRMVGEIKTAVREAILDGVIPNDFDAAYQYMLKVAREKFGLEPPLHKK